MRRVASALARARMRPAFVPEPPLVPAHIMRPSFVTAPSNLPSEIYEHEFAQVKDDATIEKMRVAAHIARDALKVALDHCRAGSTTDLVDRKCQEYIVGRNAYPTGIRFYGFPRAICTSVNEVVVHGIPDERPLEDGDIINCDVSIFYDGVFGDTSSMSFIGDVDEEGQRLCRATNEALFSAIGAIKPGASLCEVAECVEAVAASYGPGMTFTIEPVLTEGSPEITGPWDDGWTYVTRDGKRAAQYEHTVLVTDEGCEILTK
eukprot:GEMP01046268.1.p1 GENE.GEMP01046268.1~~GEMP01046268.1.p1  ORF type:complete len:262 (+),score=68.23 GEMP01046268.1:37-822(+)